MSTSKEGQPLDGSVGEGFDEYLFYLINQVQNRRVRDFTPVIEQLGLSISHWRALSTINRLNGCLMNELAEFTTADRTTLTRTVDQLVEMSLVAREASPGDRRVVRVVLTEAGLKVFDRAVDELVSHNRRVLAGLSDKDLRTLRALLQRILRNIVTDEELFGQVLDFTRGTPR